MDIADDHSLERGGPPTAMHISPGSQQIALAPDGRHLGLLRPAGDRADLVIVDRSTRREFAVADQLDSRGALQWTSDGQQLFYTENSYLQPSMRIGRYGAADGTWELTSIPVGDGQAAIAVQHAQAASFFADKHVSPDECRGANGTYPSGREGVCTFGFTSPASSARDLCVALGDPSSQSLTRGVSAYATPSS